MPRARPYHHGNLAAALLDAAMGMAAEGGPDAVVLREVARRVGVSPTAAYRHFDGQAGLTEAVKQASLGRLAEHMRAALAYADGGGESSGDGTSGPDLVPLPGVRPGSAQERAIRRLEAVGRAYFDFAVTQPGLFRSFCIGLPIPQGVDLPGSGAAGPQSAGLPGAGSRQAGSGQAGSGQARSGQAESGVSKSGRAGLTAPGSGQAESVDGRFALESPGDSSAERCCADRPEAAGAAPSSGGQPERAASPGGQPERDTLSGEPAFGVLGDVLDELVRVGVLTPARRAAQVDIALWSAVHGLAVLCLDGPLAELPRQQQYAMLTTVTDVVFHGLAGPPAGSE